MTTPPRSSPRRPAGEATESRTVEVDDTALLLGLVGPKNERLRALAREAGVEAGLRGNAILLSGPPEGVDLAERFLAELALHLRRGGTVDTADVARGVADLRQDPEGGALANLADDSVVLPARSRAITPKGAAQRRYVQAIRTHDLTFGIGPAGTGKTYLAMAMAVSALLDKKVKRIVLARPAVEAGEKLGFLPGDLAEKVNPYLRPLYDALHDMMDFERAQGLVARGQIEVAPLAFMRGRTLNDAFVILDEAQNATSEQMRMFLTRLGYGARAVVTGDVTQVDLPQGAVSGLAEARLLLGDVDGIAFCTFTDVDVVRHPLVQKIVLAYERRDADRKAADVERKGPAPARAAPPPARASERGGGGGVAS
jgi:phosphate starvation-inducible PhoH-like protein